MKPVAAGAELVDGALRNEDVERLLAAGNVEAPRQTRQSVLLRAADRAAHRGRNWPG